MSDEETVETDGVGIETDETIDTANAEGTETPEAKEGKEEKAEVEAKGEEKAGEETEEETDEDGEKKVEPFKPNLKVKVGFYKKEINDYEQKEFAIDKRFAPLMKDTESEKLVRELHEKAYGLDSVKERLTDAKANFQALAQENEGMKGSIDSLRNIVQTAVKSGNLLKLDTFFDRLKIPHEVIMKYALAKVQFAELPPEQQQMLSANMSAEQRAEMLEQQFQESQGNIATQAQQMKAMQLDYLLGQAEYKAVADEWDTRAGKPGAFRDVVAQTGQLVWLQSNGEVDLMPEQAIKQVISGYGLKIAAPGAPGNANPGANGNPASTGKKVIQREANTIPNVQGRSSSPLKQKPRSIEDLHKLRDAAIAADAG